MLQDIELQIQEQEIEKYQRIAVMIEEAKREFQIKK